MGAERSALRWFCIRRGPQGYALHLDKLQSTQHILTTRSEILHPDAPIASLPPGPPVTVEAPPPADKPGFDPNDATASTLVPSSIESYSNSTTTAVSSSASSSTSPGQKVTTYTPTVRHPTVSDAGPTSISCVSTDPDAPKTVISTSYTATTTFYGNPTDYTPPFSTLTSIPFCEPAPEYPSPAPSLPGATSTRAFPPDSGTTTFVTTDKNPKVVYKTSPPPDYSSPHEPPFGNPGQHNTARPGDGGGSGPNPPGDSMPDDPKQPPTRPTPKSPITVTAGPGKVIIGSSTIKGLKPDQSSTVVVGDETFTILPTAVIGEGGTLEKPAPVQSEWQPKPTMTSIGGVPISASGSLIEIDGTTMTIPEDGTTTQINGQDVTISPGNLHAGKDDLRWLVTSMYNTDAIVAGGEMLTAVGPTIFVLNETTITYGPDVAETEITVDNDVVTLAPEGVIVHNQTLGGPSAADGATTYGVVGGVTITHIGNSLVVVDGHTFTVEDDSDDITTVIGGEMMTIGPDGIEMGSMTIGTGDDDNLVTGTLEPRDRTGDGQPKETGGSGDGDDDEEDLAGMLKPDTLLIAGLLSFGAWVYA